MDGRKGANDQDIGEFDRLLEEIPNVTSESPHVVEPQRREASTVLAPTSVDEMQRRFYSRSHDIRNSTLATNCGDVRVSGDIAFPKKITDDGMFRSVIHHDASCLPEQSLASTFNGLSLNNGIGNMSYSPFNDQTLHPFANPFSPNRMLSTNRSNYPFGFDPRKMPITATESMFHKDYLSNPVTDGYSSFLMTDNANALSRKIDGRNDVFNDLKKSVPKSIQGYNRQICQRFPVYSHSMPMNSGMGTCFLPEVSGNDYSFPASAFLQDYFFDEKIPSYESCQQQILSKMSKCEMEDNRGYTALSQYLYLQQHQDRGSEGHHVRKVGNTENGLIPGTEAHSYFNAPFNCQPRQVYIDSYWNKHASSNIPYNQLDPSLRSSNLVRSNSKELSGRCQSCTAPRDQKSYRFPNGDDDTYRLTASNSKCHSVDDISGRVFSLAKDQHGCRLLQEVFARGVTGDVEKIFVEIIDRIVELMTDPFGNYLVQKLLDICDGNQRMEIARGITRPANELIRISCNQHGTRAVQKLVEKVNSTQEFSLITSALKPAIVLLMKDNNGNHVAQRCLQHLPPEYKEFLFYDVVGKCVELARDRQGCCVLQKCLFYLKGTQKLQLVTNIISNALLLSHDPFGNYVVQYVLEHVGIPAVVSKILDQLKGHYSTLSVLKSGSNVVEKCLCYGDNERVAEIIHELARDPHFLDIMQDQFGNYVIQTALRKSKGSARDFLLDAIKPFAPELQTNPFGKKVLSCISKKEPYASIFQKGHVDMPQNFP